MNAFSRTVAHAVVYLQTHKNLSADPREVLEWCREYVTAARPSTDEMCRQCGQAAVRECARPTKKIIAQLLEPEDLQDREWD